MATIAQDSKKKMRNNVIMAVCVCLYVCMYVHVHIYIWMCMYTYIAHTGIHSYTNTYACIHIQTHLHGLSCPVLSVHCLIQVTWPSKRGRDKEQHQQTTMPPGPHLFYWQRSWLSHTETRGLILNPGGAYLSGPVARSTRAVVSSCVPCKAQ